MKHSCKGCERDMPVMGGHHRNTKGEAVYSAHGLPDTHATWTKFDAAMTILVAQTLCSHYPATPGEKQNGENLVTKLSKTMSHTLGRAKDLADRGWLRFCASTVGRERTVNALVRRGLLEEHLPRQSDFTCPITYSLTEAGSAVTL